MVGWRRLRVGQIRHRGRGRGGGVQAIMHSREVEGVNKEGKVGHSRTPYTVEQLQLKGHYLSIHTDACEKSLCDKHTSRHKNENFMGDNQKTMRLW